MVWLRHNFFLVNKPNVVEPKTNHVGSNQFFERVKKHDLGEIQQDNSAMMRAPKRVKELDHTHEDKKAEPGVHILIEDDEVDLDLHL